MGLAGIATKVFSGDSGRDDVGLLESMDIDKMDDTGMWLWAAILTVVGLVASWLIAVWWQKRKERQKQDALNAGP